MLHSGLVSITFRQLTPADIVGLVAGAGLEAVEWGGDVHVPHGDLAAAREVRRLTEAAGLHTAAYGSYYRAGEPNAVPFERVLATAAALAAPAVRVWAGRRGSAEADDAYRQAVAADARRAAELAAAEGVKLAFEFHRGTLTDTNASAVRLLEEVSHGNAYSYWQAPAGMERAECLGGIAALTGRLLNVHVFQWGAAGFRDRRPLAEGADRWADYLAAVAAAGGDHHVMIEFVRDDSPEQFLADAAVLKSWLASLPGGC
jgi:sugar phosphate isomerase/epimerase